MAEVTCMPQTPRSMAYLLILDRRLLSGVVVSVSAVQIELGVVGSRLVLGALGLLGLDGRLLLDQIHHFTR